MTTGTIWPQLALVWILLCMTGKAILRSGLEIGNASSAGVTLAAVQPGMFPRQVEWHIVVIEGMAIGIHPIMTAQAILPIGLQVG